MAHNRDWDDDRVDPMKGSNRPTDFLKSNFKLLGLGMSFRTVKAKFPPKTIQSLAERSGVHVRIEDQTPWLKVTIIGKVDPSVAQPRCTVKQGSYRGAGKVYPPVNRTAS